GSYPMAHQWYASYLTSMGHLDKAFDEITLANKLDPLSSIIRLDLASYYFNARRYDAAVAQYRMTFAADTSFEAEHYPLLMLALWIKGDHRAAVAVLERALGRAGDRDGLRSLRQALAAAGDAGLWRWQLD